MGRLRFIHAADLHLDMPFTSLGTDEVLSHKRRGEQREALRKVCSLAKEKAVDIFLFSGDLFEHEYVQRSSIGYIKECLESLSMPVFISPGNHDPYIKNSYYCSSAWPSNVHIFTGEMDRVILENLGVCIFGVGFDDFYVHKSRLTGFRVEDEGLVNILLTHGVVDLKISEGYHPISGRDLLASGIDYAALGHIHKRTENLEGIFSYPGSLISLGFDEPDAHGFILGEMDKHSRSLEFIPLDARRYVTDEVEISGCTSQEDMARAVADTLDDAAEQNFYRIVLTGRHEPGFEPDLDLIREGLLKKVALLQLLDSTIPGYSLEILKREKSLKGLFTARMLQKIEDQSQDKTRLQRALYLGLDALDGIRISRRST